jgi:hypothetical protein
MVLAVAAKECGLVGRPTLDGTSGGRALSEIDVGAPGLTAGGEGSAANDCEKLGTEEAPEDELRMGDAPPPPPPDVGGGEAEAPNSIFRRSCTRLDDAVGDADEGDVDCAERAAAAEKLWLSAATLLMPCSEVEVEVVDAESPEGREAGPAALEGEMAGFAGEGGGADGTAAMAGVCLSRGDEEGEGVVDVEGVAAGDEVADDDCEAVADEAGESDRAGDEGG